MSILASFNPKRTGINSVMFAMYHATAAPRERKRIVFSHSFQCDFYSVRIARMPVIAGKGTFMGHGILFAKGMTAFSVM